MDAHYNLVREMQCNGMRSDGYLRLRWILVLLCSDHKFARAAFECL
jgi:hypothetical protein